jgi:subtilisin family serine protease
MDNSAVPETDKEAENHVSNSDKAKSSTDLENYANDSKAEDSTKNIKSAPAKTGSDNSSNDINLKLDTSSLEDNNPSKKIIVVFKDKVDKKAIEQSNATINCEYTSIPAVSITINPSKIKDLEKNSNIASIENDQIVQVSSQTESWGISTTNAPKAWESNYTGKGVKIAVIDTGIANHEDLNISGGVSFVQGVTSYADDFGHGTHVAGIIGAKNNTVGTIGMAYEASLYAVKVLDKTGEGSLANVAKGIDWAIKNKMDIVNMSLGDTTTSPVLKSMVDTAYNKGILIVAAAGNSGTSDGTEDTVNFPARYSSVISVAAVDKKSKRASFSSTGTTVEVAAPGVDIVSTYLNNTYATMSGTSMACPYVAGDLALLKQAYPDLSNTELRQKLQESVIDLGSSGKDTWYGYGLIQAPVKDITEPSLKQTSTFISTDSDTYFNYENIRFQTTVRDGNNKIISDADVKFIIIAPNGEKMYYNGQTDSNGIYVCTFNNVLKTKGTYQVIAKSSHDGYENSSATMALQIKNVAGSTGNITSKILTLFGLVSP